MKPILLAGVGVLVSEHLENVWISGTCRSINTMHVSIDDRWLSSRIQQEVREALEHQYGEMLERVRKSFGTTLVDAAVALVATDSVERMR
jgi:hypothetical protein